MRADLRYLLAGLAGTAGFTFLALAFPDMSRFFTIPAAIACFILTVHLVWPDIREFAASPRWGLKRMWPQYLMALGGILFFVGVIGFLQLNVKPPPPPLEIGKANPEVPNEFSGWTNHQLIERVKEVVSGMRELEQEYAINNLATLGLWRTGSTEEERARLREEE
jgi:hypothetical protein